MIIKNEFGLFIYSLIIIYIFTLVKNKTYNEILLLAGIFLLQFKLLYEKKKELKNK